MVLAEVLVAELAEALAEVLIAVPVEELVPDWAAPLALGARGLR